MSYGTVTFIPTPKPTWVITCQPHVMIRLKRHFERISKKEHGTVYLSATPENSRELDWFMQRYPMQVEQPEVLAFGVRKHIEREEHVQALLQGRRSELLGAIEMALPAREYQLIAAQLATTTGRLLLADELGLGKTCSSLAMIAMSGKLPALIVTLTHLPPQWADELAKFIPSVSCHILKKATPYPLEVDGYMPDIIISNYHKLSGWAETLAPIIKAVIFDEGHELRREKSAKYSAAKHLAEACDLRAALTGTPIFNYGGEIYNVLNVLEEGCLGTADEFRREWCSDYDDNGKILIEDPKAFGLYLQDQGLMLRRTRKDVGRELPALTTVPHVIEIDESELAAVEGVAGELARLILSEETLEKGAKFKAGGELDFRLRLATGVAKAPFVAEFVRMLVEGGDKILLFGWHHQCYDIWATRLHDLRPAFYTGKTSQAEKAIAKQRFLDGDTDLLIMSLRSGAGIDGLQKVCRNVVFGELDWSPACHRQCVGRVHRDGQEHPVMAYYPIATSGSDPVVADVLGVKRGQLDGIIDPDAPLVDTGVDPNHIRRLALDVIKRMESKPPKPAPAIVIPKPIIATPIHARSRMAWTEQPNLFADGVA